MPGLFDVLRTKLTRKPIASRLTSLVVSDHPAQSVSASSQNPTVLLTMNTGVINENARFRLPHTECERIRLFRNLENFLLTPGLTGEEKTLLEKMKEDVIAIKKGDADDVVGNVNLSLYRCEMRILQFLNVYNDPSRRPNITAREKTLSSIDKLLQNLTTLSDSERKMLGEKREQLAGMRLDSILLRVEIMVCAVLIESYNVPERVVSQMSPK